MGCEVEAEREKSAEGEHKKQTGAKTEPRSERTRGDGAGGRGDAGEGAEGKTRTAETTAAASPKATVYS